MAVHYGGKVGAAGRRLASKSSSKSTKSKAAKELVNQKALNHFRAKGGSRVLSKKPVRKTSPCNPDGLLLP